MDRGKSRRVSTIGGAVAQIYCAPVGDPALGPVAYPHRASAQELPQAPIGHHWEDSTHIATNVVTAGVRYGKFQMEEERRSSDFRV